MGKVIKCTKAESIGRAKFIELATQNGIEDITPTEDYFDPVDLFYSTKAGQKVAVEVKNRGEQYECYSTYLMELNKYHGMKKRMKEENSNFGLYVYFFADHAYLYNIETIFRNKVTYRQRVHANSYDDRTTVKDMMQFDKRLALCVYHKIDGKWVKQ